MFVPNVYPYKVCHCHSRSRHSGIPLFGNLTSKEEFCQRSPSCFPKVRNCIPDVRPFAQSRIQLATGRFKLRMRWSRRYKSLSMRARKGEDSCELQEEVALIHATCSDRKRNRSVSTHPESTIISTRKGEQASPRCVRVVRLVRARGAAVGVSLLLLLLVLLPLLLSSLLLLLPFLCLESPAVFGLM